MAQPDRMSAMSLALGCVPGSHRMLRRENMLRSRQFTTRFVLFAAAIVACCVLVVSGLFGPIIPQSRLRLIQSGMTEQDVIRLLGDPTSRTTDGELVYERQGNPGWVIVCFDNDGLVSYVDDESAFP